MSIAGLSFAVFVSVTFGSLYSASGQMSIKALLPAGEYRLIAKAMMTCKGVENHQVKYYWYLHHNPDNSTEIRGNITANIPIDDTMFLDVTVAIKQKNGGWKENTLTHRSAKACSGLYFIFGSQIKQTLIGFGIPPVQKCPLPSGVYVAPGLDTSVLEKMNFPKTFLYGEFKIRMSLTRNDEVIGCFIMIIELLRL